MTKSQLTIFIASLTITTIVLFDRILKIFFSHLLSLDESVQVVRNFFYFTLVHNTGIAFGFFKNQSIIFVVISTIAIILFSVYLYLHRKDEYFGLLEVFGFSLIIGGALGNLIDRILFGHVIDFIDFRVWPVFNLADSAITVGTVIILIKCIPSSSK